MKKYIYPLLLATNFCVALPFNSQDARSRSMGGTGVASSNPGSASYYNPALLSHYKKDQDFSIIFPNLSGSLRYKTEVKDALVRINDENYILKIGDSIAGLNERSQPSFVRSRDQFVANSKALSNNLNILSGHAVTATIRPLDISLSFPDDNVGFAIYTKTSLHVQAVPHVSECDLQLMGAFSDMLEDIDPDNLHIPATEKIDLQCEEREQALTIDLIDQNSGELIDFTTGVASDGKGYLLSSSEAALIVINETGLSISHQFIFQGIPVSIGLTPKYLSVATAYAFPTVKSISDNTFEAEEFFTDNYQRDGRFSADLGVAVDFLKDRSLTVGLIVKNMIPQTYESLPFDRYENGSLMISRKFEINTQVRAGVSFHKYGFTLATDVDLTENSALFFGNSTQYAALGAEYDIADVNIVMLRAGAKINMKESADTTYSAGIGLNVFALHLDLGADMGDEYLAGALQLGLDF